MAQYGPPIAPSYRVNPAYRYHYPYQVPRGFQNNQFHNTPEFGTDLYRPVRQQPPKDLIEFWQTQNPELTIPALIAFAQQYAAQQKQADPGIALTPKKGAKVGAVALAALGFIVHGWRGLISGGLVGAVAGWLITKSLLEKEIKQSRSR